jgi:MFS superfamily sulfate permease-like transporter
MEVGVREFQLAAVRLHGEAFFASSNDLVGQFDYVGDPDRVVSDLSNPHVWDASSVVTPDVMTTKYAASGKTVEITGLNEASQAAQPPGRRTFRQPLRSTH